MALAGGNGMLLSRALEGAVDVWKLSASVCPDRQMAKGDGALCKLCPLGRAGTGGLCPVCRPGTYAAEEGAWTVLGIDCDNTRHSSLIMKYHE